MASLKDKPRGYFEKILAIDCETTGFVFTGDDPSCDPTTGEIHQAVSWGIIVADAKTLKPIDEMYIEIQWNEDSIRQRNANPAFGSHAEKIHGLTKEHLDEHGFTEEEAVEAIGSLIIKHWGPTNCICLLGHNVATFDLRFLKRLFRKFEIELKFGNRHLDTNTVGFVNWGTFNSDDLFEMVGFEARGDHNALSDARMSLDSARITRELFTRLLEGE